MAYFPFNLLSTAILVLINPCRLINGKILFLTWETVNYHLIIVTLTRFQSLVLQT